jgi:mitochondrial fission protein ELM1
MSANEPMIWCLLGRKAGDNTQVRALAKALDLPVEEKQIAARPWELLTHLGLRVTLAGIDRKKSDALHAPWPDIVITAGRRNEPVARWIKKQSGGASKLVHIGRPWSPLEAFDLVVTTPQYFLPRQDNILHNNLPLHQLSQPVLEHAARSLLPQIEQLPPPWVVVLVGGDSGRFVFTPAKAQQLAEHAAALAASCGGSVLVTDSPRTPARAGDILQAALPQPHYCHRWGGGGKNPYLGLLAVGDAFVVTGESMSMLGEAASRGKPLYIFDMGDGDTPWWKLWHNYRYKPVSHRLAMRFAPRRMRRDVGNIQSVLVAGGQAQWLDSESRFIGTSVPGSGLPGAEHNQELENAAAAVRRLLIPS